MRHDETLKQTKELIDQGQLDEAVTLYGEQTQCCPDDSRTAVRMLTAGKTPPHPGGYIGKARDFLCDDRVDEAKNLLRITLPRATEKMIDDIVDVLREDNLASDIC